MTEKRYYTHKHLLQENKVHDKICHNFMNIDETVEHMNNQYWKYKHLKEENEQLKDALNQRTDQCDKYYKENKELKKQVNDLQFSKSIGQREYQRRLSE